MAFEPIKPQTYHPPLKVADDTYLIQQLQEAAIGPLWVYLNSLVIKGPEPIIVDTGTPANREQWMQDVFSIVDPGDVKWIYLSLMHCLATGKQYVWEPPPPPGA